MKRGYDLLGSSGAAPSSSRNVDVEAALTAATAMGSHVGRLPMPWESTPLMRSIFQKDKMPWLAAPKIPRTFPAVSSSGASERIISDHEHKLRIRDLSHEVAGSSRDMDRDRVLLKWLEVILIQPSESRVGKQLMEVKVDDGDCGRHLQIVADTLMKKATRTLNLRVASLLLYIRWLRKHSLSEQFLPFYEPTVYDYMCDLRDTACSATRGTTFISTLEQMPRTFGNDGNSLMFGIGQSVRCCSANVSDQEASQTGASVGTDNAGFVRNDELLSVRPISQMYGWILLDVHLWATTCFGYASDCQFVSPWSIRRGKLNACQDCEGKRKTIHLFAVCCAL